MKELPLFDDDVNHISAEEFLKQIDERASGGGTSASHLRENPHSHDIDASGNLSSPFCLFSSPKIVSRSSAGLVGVCHNGPCNQCTRAIALKEVKRDERALRISFPSFGQRLPFATAKTVCVCVCTQFNIQSLEHSIMKVV